MTNLVVPKSPNLPIGPVEYDRRYQDQFNNTLRLYFERLDNVLGALTQYSASASEVTTYTATTVTLSLTSGVALIDTTAGNTTVSLPDAATSIGYLFTVKRITAGANTLTINAVSGNIDQSASTTISTRYAVLSFRSDGTNYWIV